VTILMTGGDRPLGGWETRCRVCAGPLPRGWAPRYYCCSGWNCGCGGSYLPYNVCSSSCWENEVEEEYDLPMTDEDWDSLMSAESRDGL
jgi:hypothetical protein